MPRLPPHVHDFRGAEEGARRSLAHGARAARGAVRGGRARQGLGGWEVGAAWEAERGPVAALLKLATASTSEQEVRLCAASLLGEHAADAAMGEPETFTALRGAVCGTRGTAHRGLLV